MPSDPNHDDGGRPQPATASAVSSQGYSGRYSDGRTAATRSVPVGFGGDGLHIVHVDTGETLIWPYATLSTAQPLSAGTPDALLRSTSQPGATVFVASPGFVAELIGNAPQLTAKAERWRYLKPALAAVAVVAALSGLVWALNWSPARAVAMLVPDRTWNAAGRQLASSFEKDYPGCTDAAGQAALDKIVRRLTEASPDKRPINLHLANWNLVNAFAMPGRHLMLTRGLIRDATSPEEVAGVLGHEMGHAIELHPEAGLVRHLGLTVALKLMFAGTSDSLQNVGGLLLLLRYTRVGERQADQRAFELLEKARISAKPLGDFFDRLAKKEGGGGYAKIARRYEFLSSHPALDERAANARARPEYPVEPIMSAAEWQAMRGMCKGPASSAPPKTDSPPPTTPSPDASKIHATPPND